MNTSIDDDLRGKKIEINNDPLHLSSSENLPQAKSNNSPVNFMKNAYSKLVTNIKSLTAKKENTENKVPEPPKTENVVIYSSKEPQEVPEPKTCKDKVADTIINKVEVQKNRTVFFSLLAIGSFLLCISILTIPFVITSPSKFSMTLAFGSAFISISFLFYYGTKNYVTKLFDKKRFGLSILFICSVITAIILWIVNNYFLSLLSSIFQVICLILFALSFIPGGQSGINFIKKKISSPFVRIFMNAARREITNS